MADESTPIATERSSAIGEQRPLRDYMVNRPDDISNQDSEIVSVIKMVFGAAILICAIFGAYKFANESNSAKARGASISQRLSIADTAPTQKRRVYYLVSGAIVCSDLRGMTAADAASRSGNQIAFQMILDRYGCLTMPQTMMYEESEFNYTTSEYGYLIITVGGRRLLTTMDAMQIKNI